MTLTIHKDLEQGSDEWLALRCGVLTASEIKLILTPTLKSAANDKSRAHVMEITSQRISKFVEPTYISDDMLRGHEAEVFAREHYERAYGPVQQVGFITNDKWGFTLGYSPDGLVGADGLWECKGPRQKRHVETILTGEVPVDNMLQLQAGLLISERQWIDFTSYHGGLPMVTLRVWPDEKVQEAIVDAAGQFEESVAANVAKWQERMGSDMRLIETERVIDEEVYLG